MPVQFEYLIGGKVTLSGYRLMSVESGILLDGNLFVCLLNDTMVSITHILCHEDRYCRMRSLPNAPHDQCRESNPSPLDFWSSALPTRPRDHTLVVGGYCLMPVEPEYFLDHKVA